MKKRKKIYLSQDCLQTADEIATFYNSFADGKREVSDDGRYGLSQTNITVKKVPKSVKSTSKKSKKSAGIAEAIIGAAKELADENPVDTWEVTVTSSKSAPKMVKEGADLFELLLNLRKAYINLAIQDVTDDYLKKKDYNPYVDYKDYH